MLRIVAALLFVGLGSATPAEASTAFVEQVDGYVNVRFVGAPGETNDVRVVVGKEQVVFRDGDQLSAGAKCQRGTDGAVSCPIPANEIYVDLGDGDDRVAVEADPAGNLVYGGTLAGGAGNDSLSSSLLGWDFYGGEGNDALTGSDGSDTFHGEPGSDRYDGRGGEDNLFFTWFEGFTAPLDVDLVSARATTMGDTDSILNVEHITGPSGGTHYVGDAGANSFLGEGGDAHRDDINGAAGDDSLRGHGVVHGGDGNDFVGSEGPDSELYGDAGDDHLRGDFRHDTMNGGDGNDFIDVGEGIGTNFSYVADTVTCGPGLDVVQAASLRDDIAADCELAAPRSSSSTLRVPLRLERPSARKLVTSVSDVAGRIDRAAIVLRADKDGFHSGRVLARTRSKPAGVAPTRFVVTIPKRLCRTLRSVQMVARWQEPGYDTNQSTFVMRVPRATASTRCG